MTPFFCNIGRAPRAGVRTRLRLGAPEMKRAFQIGPRIRVGGTIGKIGQGIKNTLNNTKVLGVPLGAGLGAAAGGLPGLLEAESARPGGLSNLPQDLAAGARNAAVAAPLIGAIGGAGTSAASGGSSDMLSKLKSLIASGGSDMAGMLGVGGGSSTGSSLLDKLLLGGSVAAGAADKAKQSGLIDKATGYATGAYDDRSPLRTRALAQLSTDQPAPDLSSIFANSGNVYDRQRRGMAPLATTPSAASQVTAGDALSGSLGARIPVQPPVAAALPAPTTPSPMAKLAASY